MPILAWCVNNVVAAFNQEKAPFGPSCGPSSTSSHRVAVEGAGAGCAGVAPGAAQRGAAQLAGAHHPLQLGGAAGRGSGVHTAVTRPSPGKHFA